MELGQVPEYTLQDLALWIGFWIPTLFLSPMVGMMLMERAKQTVNRFVDDVILVFINGIIGFWTKDKDLNPNIKLENSFIEWILVHVGLFLASVWAVDESQLNIFSGAPDFIDVPADAAATITALVIMVSMILFHDGANRYRATPDA